MKFILTRVSWYILNNVYIKMVTELRKIDLYRKMQGKDFSIPVE